MFWFVRYIRFFEPLMIQANGGGQSKNCWRAGRLVEGILAAKRTGNAATVAALESEIDAHVFRLYALTPAEIALVKSTTVK